MFLIDRCAGRRLADWLRSSGQDVVETGEFGPDPGDRVLLDRAPMIEHYKEVILHRNAQLHPQCTCDPHHGGEAGVAILG